MSYPIKESPRLKSEFQKNLHIPFENVCQFVVHPTLEKPQQASFSKQCAQYFVNNQKCSNTDITESLIIKCWNLQSTNNQVYSNF